jgi:hypothetical protein
MPRPTILFALNRAVPMTMTFGSPHAFDSWSARFNDILLIMLTRESGL